MFIILLAIYLSNKIAVGLYYLLQTGPDSAVGPPDILPGDVGKHLFDGGDEGLLDVISGPICVPLNYTPLKINPGPITSSATMVGSSTPVYLQTPVSAL